MFKVPEFRIPSYESVSRRLTPLTAKETSRLTVDDVTTIYALREYNATDSNKFRALLTTLGIYFVPYYISTFSLLFINIMISSILRTEQS